MVTKIANAERKGTKGGTNPCRKKRIVGKRSAKPPAGSIAFKLFSGRARPGRGSGGWGAIAPGLSGASSGRAGSEYGPARAATAAAAGWSVGRWCRRLQQKGDLSIARCAPAREANKCLRRAAPPPPQLPPAQLPRRPRPVGRSDRRPIHALSWRRLRPSGPAAQPGGLTALHRNWAIAGVVYCTFRGALQRKLLDPRGDDQCHRNWDRPYSATKRAPREARCFIKLIPNLGQFNLTWVNLPSYRDLPVIDLVSAHHIVTHSNLT